MHKLTFTLKQHTPIIHFQHDQDGATLRATEVKPKLDRFILTKLGRGASEETKYKSGAENAKEKKWLVGTGEHAALDYKLKFNVSNLVVDNYVIEKGKDYVFAPFFGNMGVDYEDNKKSLSLIKNSFANQIICGNELLAKEIINFLYDFFYTNNFGTRQSKGFGSFEVSSITLDGISQGLANQFNFRYHFKIPIKISTDNWALSYKEIFSRIDLFYRTLRSGINVIGRDKLYLKSSLFQYLYSKNIQWDKKTIKAHYFNGEDILITETKTSYNNAQESDKTIKYISTQNREHQNADILNKPKLQDSFLNLRDYRDVLGLSSEESWLSYIADLTKKEAKFNGAKWIAKPDKEVEIARYKSPILFKPIINGDDIIVYFDVFLMGNEQSDFYGKNILIDLKHKKDSRKISYSPSLQSKNKSDLVLPIANDLNVVEYLSWAFKNISPKANVKPHFNVLSDRARDIVNNLETIYAELKSQIR